LADLLASTLNPNLGGANHVAPLVEKQVIGWIRDMVGFPADSSGLLTSGASMANFTALTVARNANCGYDVRRQGVRAAPGPLTAYASSEIHSCNQKAVETLGLGSEGLRRIPARDDYTLDLVALERQVAADRASGRLPFCVIATAGTINTGAIDDLHAIADFCAREGCGSMSTAPSAPWPCWRATCAPAVRHGAGGLHRPRPAQVDAHLKRAA
jgi:glutamate/tyrosine decarboxylase-like PLP-dependent enzyme